MNTEQQLSETLRREGQGFVAPSIGFDQVRAQARVVQRRRTTALLAAAGLCAAGIVGGFSLIDQPGRSTEPPVIAPTPSATPQPTATAVGPLDLDQIEVGGAPQVPYLLDGQVYSPETDPVAFPGGPGVTSFGTFHGGWVAIRGYENLTQYSATGAQVRSGKGTGPYVDADGARIGFGIDGTVFAGSPMAEGETEVSLPAGAVFDGFVASSFLVYHLPSGDVQLSDGKSSQALPGINTVRATSSSADLIAATTPDDKVAVLRTNGEVLWQTRAWIPHVFSPDGKLLAVLSTSEGEQPTARVAILDSRTGRRMAFFRLTEHNLELINYPRWDDNSHLLFGVGQRDSKKFALLRLGVDKSLDRATRVFEGATPEFVISD